jgi:hypothetical protein
LELVVESAAEGLGVGIGLGDETVDGGPKDNDGAKDPAFQSSPDEPALSRSSELTTLQEVQWPYFG